MEIPQVKRSFPPIVDHRTRLLLLGSLPGEQSLAAGRYYAHPRNQFWLLMGEVIGRDLAALGYDERLKALLDAGVGLWDVVESATRIGSLDTKIRDHRPNLLADLAASLRGLRAVAFNGGTSSRIGRMHLQARPDLQLITLPSSSPAHTMRLSEKQHRWNALQPWLLR